MQHLRLGVIVALGALAACERAEPPAAPGGGPTGIRFLAEGEGDGFERALRPRPFRFPQDHGSHPGFRTEWWYYTGNLEAADGRHFGFELTFFRLALTATPVRSGSAWAAEQAWMAHFAITDTARDEFHAEERFARGALGLAGAQTDRVRVWVEGWEALFGGPDGAEIRLRAAASEASLDLLLRAAKPPVTHGVDGLDAKGPEPGNASYYYSFSRLDAEGTVAVGGETVAVRGLAWMDREWGTSALSPGVVGWDWFALQLDDGRDLMWYRLRSVDGTTNPFSGGSLIDAAGVREPLGAADAALAALGTWRSASTGVTYPVRWRLTVPRAGLELEVEPVLESQEMALSVRYWEGAVRVTGTAGGRPISGRGYLELAGY